MEVAALLGVHEVFHLKDLEFPILLGESENGESIILECGATRGGAKARPLPWFMRCGVRRCRRSAFGDEPGAPLFLVLRPPRGRRAKGGEFQLGCPCAQRRLPNTGYLHQL